MSEKPFCRECLQRLGDKPSREAVWALGLATLGMLLWVPGLFAIPLASRELQRIKAGEASEAGRDFASLARGLGWFDAVVGGIGIAVWVWRELM